MMLHIEMFVLNEAFSWCNCVVNNDLISAAEIMYNKEEGRMLDFKFNCQNLRPRWREAVDQVIYTLCSPDKV